MTTLARTGPLRDAQAVDPTVRWTTLETMQIAASFDARDAQRLQNAGICDLSHRRRAGVKGPAAKAWLNSLGVQTPEQPNSWLRCDDGALVARLGLTEYVVVGIDDGAAIERIVQTTPTHGVYPVARFDTDLLLGGRLIHDLLKQTCAFDFEGLERAARPLVMTSMVGVGVTVLALPDQQGLPCYGLWCDGTYGPYLWRTLVEVATELGGGAVGIDAIDQAAD